VIIWDDRECSRSWLDKVVIDSSTTNRSLLPACSLMRLQRCAFGSRVLC